METIKERLSEANYLQVALVALFAAVGTGVLPLADGANLAETLKVLGGLIGLSLVTDVANLRLVVGQLAQVDLGKKLNAVLDTLDAMNKALPPEPPVGEGDTVEVKPLAKFEAQG